MGIKQLLFLHPAGQFCALVFGLLNLVTGVTKKAFNKIMHINCGLLYYFMVTFGVIIGITVQFWSAAGGIKIYMQYHIVTGAGILALFCIGGYTGFKIFKDTGVNRNAVTLHRWSNGLSVGLFFIQLITGIKELLNVL